MGDGASLRAVGATFLAAGLSALGAWGLVAQSSCALSNCDGDVVFLDGPYPNTEDPNHRDPPPNGKMIGENTWESSPINGDWLIYPPQRTYVISADLKSAVERTPIDIIAYVAPTTLGKDRDSLAEGFTLNPNGTQFAAASGNISEISVVTPSVVGTNHVLRFNIHNDTCAAFILRVVIHLEPLSSATLDGGTTDAPLDDAEAGPNDDASAHD